MSRDIPRGAVTRRSAIIAGLAASGLPETGLAATAQRDEAEGTKMAASEGTTKLREAWKVYDAAVERNRLAMEATPRFRNRPEHRATAYTSLAEAQSMAYYMAVAPRMDHPVINTRTWYHNVHTLGGTSADLYHVTANVDGRHTYRLSGRVGDMKILVMQVFNTVFGGPGQKQVATADLAAMADAHGNFEAVLSARPQPGNWIRLDPESDENFLFIRRFFDDWYGDRGTLDIELLDGPIDNKDLDEATAARRILRAADVLTFLVEKWNIGIYDLYLTRNHGRKNAVAVVPGSEIASDSAGSPATIYSWGIFDIKDDEALLIEYEKPEAGFWSLQVQDVWTKPLDYLDHQSDINQKQAAIDGDGKFRAVISITDPGVANWLDTAGRREGTIVGRAYHARKAPQIPVVTLVKLADLKTHLPADTTYVTPAQRQAAIKLRRDGLLKMFGDT